MENLSIKNALKDLIYLNEQLRKVLRDHPEYEELINILIKEDFMSDYCDLPAPTITSIIKSTGLKPHVIRKQIKEIHKIFFSIENPVLEFMKVEYWVCLTWGKRHFKFILKGLPVIPRIGEDCNIPFLEGVGMARIFYVEKVEHSFKGNKQVVTLWLYSGSANSYLKKRRDKAKALKELPGRVFWELDNYGMEIKIRSGELDP